MIDDETAVTRQQPVQVHQAEGVLAVLLGVPIEQAVLSLDLRAQFRGISLAEAARQVMDDHARGVDDAVVPEIGDRTLAILRQHLDSVSSPLDNLN